MEVGIGNAGNRYQNQNENEQKQKAIQQQMQQKKLIFLRQHVMKENKGLILPVLIQKITWAAQEGHFYLHMNSKVNEELEVPISCKRNVLADRFSVTKPCLFSTIFKVTIWQKYGSKEA